MAIDGVDVVLIAAVARNGVIGRDGDLPWRIPSDFRHFKAVTMGKPIVMGRKQFESVGKPLPGRVNIVISRQPGYQPDGVLVFRKLEDGLAHAARMAKADGETELMVIGGGEIYAQAMSQADRLVISHVDLDIQGDVRFPEIDPDLWDMRRSLPVVPHRDDAAAYRINVYERRPATH